MKKSKRLIVILAVMIPLMAGILISILILSPPPPYSGKDPAAFSAVSASSWIREISQKPHSVFDRENHDQVRAYLESELKNLGLEVSTKTFTLQDANLPEPLPIVDIHGKLDGLSDDAILLVAHYDSAFNWDEQFWKPLPGLSYGAADDGYGLGVVLETLRAIKALKQPLENDIQVLITDAEELGMTGADLEVQQNAGAFANVKLVINVEARGIKGPAVMFETGNNNAASMDYFTKYAANGFSYSCATDIYRMMPNGTDFTCFAQKGFSGFNFSVLDNLDYYHTAKDNFSNISLPSIQHYGNQIHAIVRQFTTTPQAGLPSLKSDHNKVFFNILPGILLSYGNTATLIQLLLAMAAMLLLVAVMRKKQPLNLGKVFGTFAGFMGCLLSAFLFGTLIAWLASLVFNKTFELVYLPNIPGADLILAAVLGISGLFLFMLVKRWMRKNPSGMEALMGSVLLNILLGLASYKFLAGAAFLFSIPALTTMAYALVIALWPNRIAWMACYALLAITVPILFIPLSYLFYLALTLGSAGVIAFFTLIALSTLLPATMHFSSSLRASEEPSRADASGIRAS